MADTRTLARQLDAASKEGPGENPFKSVVKEIVKCVVESVAVYEDEVAIFLPKGADTFRFAAPLPLLEDGSSFPSKGSLTLKVYNGDDPLVNNNVKVGKPLSIYERAKISERSPKPIQKMLAVPLKDREGKVGVLQVSRRGVSVREAGPDFGSKEEMDLTSIGKVAAPYLRRTRPEAF
ncbi:MAG: hypothetical protein U0166_15510 [Acidobacteriota bacterium]